MSNRVTAMHTTQVPQSRTQPRVNRRQRASAGRYGATGTRSLQAAHTGNMHAYFVSTFYSTHVSPPQHTTANVRRGLFLECGQQRNTRRQRTLNNPPRRPRPVTHKHHTATNLLLSSWPSIVGERRASKQARGTRTHLPLRNGVAASRGRAFVEKPAAVPAQSKLSGWCG